MPYCEESCPGAPGKQVTLKARHIPGRLNVIVDKLSRLGQTIQTEWSLHPEVFKAISSRWHQPQVDLFATRFNNKLPQFVSPGPDPQAWAVDALSPSWENLDPYAFPPAAILGKVVKLQDYPCSRIIKRPLRDACLCMGELQAPPALLAPHFVFLITL